MFGYGSNNVINFEKYNIDTIIGIFAPNSFGKSSLIDIITFILYSTSARSDDSYIPIDIINYNFDTFFCQGLISYGN